jgi:hypothetical protein
MQRILTQFSGILEESVIGAMLTGLLGTMTNIGSDWFVQKPS